MGKMTEMDLASGDFCNKTRGLSLHLTTKEELEKTTRALTEEGRKNITQMAKSVRVSDATVRNVDGLYRYFESFLNEEDDCG